jgi:hypothetical protein
MAMVRNDSWVARGVILLIVSGTGCAAGGWTEMRTKRITAYSQTPAVHGETVTQLEDSFAALSAFFPKVDIGTVEVLFMGGWDQGEAFGSNRGGLVIPGVPGAEKIGRENLIVMDKDEEAVKSMDLMSHLFLHKAVPNGPLWLHQSLSTYLHNILIQEVGGKWRVCFGVVGQWDYRRIFRMPLDRYFSITWRTYAESEPNIYTGTGRLLMEFIFHGDGGVHLSQLPKIFVAAVQGVPGPQIMDMIFPGLTLEQLGERIAAAKNVGRTERTRDAMMCPLPLTIPDERRPDHTSAKETAAHPEEIAQLMTALKRLPHGDRYPSWYPPEISGTSTPPE